MWIPVLAGLLLAVSAQKAPDSGYLFTCPKVLQAGTVERGCVSLYNFAGPGRSLKLTISEQDAPRVVLPGGGISNTDFELFQVQADIPDDVTENGEYCFDIEVPKKVTARNARVQLELKNGAGVSYEEESKVSIKSYTLLTLVQTDKAKYQPGQKVLFRVVTLKHDLTALTDDLEEVWITTPQGTRLAQWRDVSTQTGMVQLEMQLTEEPPLGSWTVHVKAQDSLVQKSFDVEEYVLPTFEVKVETPDRIQKGEKTLTVKVCGKYTFGKPLIGANITVNATASIQSYEYDRVPDLLRNITDYQLSDEEGCAEFDLLVSKLGIGHSNIYGTKEVTVTATVEEFGTGLKQVEKTSVSEEFSSISLALADNSQQFIKPKLPYYGQAVLKDQDGNPAAGQNVKVCYTATYKERTNLTIESDKPQPIPDDILYRAVKKLGDHVTSRYGYTPLFWETENPKRRTTGSQCREYETDEAGRATFYIPPQAEDVDSVDINLSAKIGSDSDRAYHSLVAFFSPSRTYLTIDAHDLPDKLPCSGDVTVQLLTSLEDTYPTVVYKILSRGRIVNVGMTTFNATIPIVPKMGPEFKLLAYFVLPSGEVVSDARVFKVDECFPNQVEVSWDKETVKPGDSASFTVRAAPNSVCGVSAVDKSTELLGTSNQITADTVFSKLRQFVIGRYQHPTQVGGDDAYCKELQKDLVATLREGGATDDDLVEKKEGEEGEGIQSSLAGGSRYPGPPFREPTFRTDRQDALSAFDESGFLVMSNLAVETRPCYKRVEAEVVPEDLLIPQKGVAGPPQVPYYSPAVAAYQHSLHADYAVSVTGVVPMAHRKDAAFAVGGAGGGGAPPPPQEDQVREFFPEAFLFSIETLDADGTKVLTNEMPDTITSWVGSAICTNSEDGFGLSNKTSITTFKPFFTEVTLPYSVKRGEVLNMSATVFNFLESDLSVYVELAESEEYTLKGDESVPYGFDLCIPAGRSTVSYFPLDFSSLGEVNITVTAKAKDGNCETPNTIQPGSDTVIRPLLIKPEGFPQEVTTSRFICLDEGDENHVEKISLPLPEGLVPDSARAFFSVIGDLLAPSLNNLGHLISAPSGGGEPNMLTFVPNIYIRGYLEETGLLTDSNKQETYNNMLSGYQRQLRYRRSDGSYSTYGPSDPEPSLWLTAYVVESFQEASEYIDIDQDSLKQSSDWLISQQQENGCFPRTGELIHKELKGGVEYGGEAALTAFVMLALKDVASTDELAGGFACLEDGLLLPNKSLYSEVLMAHTYVKLGLDVKGARMVEKLLEKATREGDDILYWQGDRSAPFGASEATDLEMTAYMVLSLVELSGKGNMEEAAKAVKWINQQRNSQGGFISSRDTVVALNALTEFAKRTYSSDQSTSVSVSTGASSTAQQMSVNPDNRLLLQEQKVPELTLPAEITFEVSPPGCVIVQTSFRYSSKAKVPDPAFSLGVATKARPGRQPGSSYMLEVCTSYIRPRGTVDRATLSVELPSGYTPVASTLRKLLKVPAVKRYDIGEGSATFTLAGVGEDKTCLEFRILRETEVSELKPSVVKINDFYRPSDKNELEYELTPPTA